GSPRHEPAAEMVRRRPLWRRGAQVYDPLDTGSLGRGGEGFSQRSLVFDESGGVFGQAMDQVVGDPTALERPCDVGEASHVRLNPRAFGRLSPRSRRVPTDTANTPADLFE